MQLLNLFDTSLWALEYENHNEQKDKILRVVEDIYNTAPNTNSFNHSLVYQSTPDFQFNNVIKDLVSSECIHNFCQQMAANIILPHEKKFAITSMWFSIIPPYGEILPHEAEGVFFGSYFLHSPAAAGMIGFYSAVSDLYYSKFGNMIHNEFNHNKRMFNMPEGGIYCVPSYVKTMTTTNMSEETSIQINFVLDIVEK